MSWVSALARPEIVALRAYEPASWEPEFARLHANELPWRAGGDDSRQGLNRYPEPQPRTLLEQLASLYEVPGDALLVARGSDEVIDLLIRVFCRAGQDAVLICPPTFGMYEVAARIQGADVVAVPLRAGQGFALDPQAVVDRCAPGVKIVFLCSPNNPTGNTLDSEALLRVARELAGRALVVADEAYIEFSRSEGLVRQVQNVRNLAVLRTLSKAHGLAGARVGALIADPEVIRLVRKVIPPYAISQLTVEAVLKTLEPSQCPARRARITQVRAERQRLAEALKLLPGVTRVWPSDANFVLAEFADAEVALRQARAARLLVRDARGYGVSAGALRITVGTAEQNAQLLEVWR